MTFTATGEVVRYFNANPVIVDVERETHNIIPKNIEAAITPRTRSIIPVHFGGQAADMDEIMEIARQHNLTVIEDAAHCFPSLYKEKPIGKIGDITTFSFYATKTIACGEGGMATTENAAYAEDMRIHRLHGISKDAWKRYTKEGSWYYEVVDAGFKYNMTDIQAALGLAQLAKAALMFQKRKHIAQCYSNAFKESPYIDSPIEKADRKTSWHLYVIKLNNENLKISRNEFIERLLEKNISTSVHFIPLYRHPYYKKICKIDPAEMPNSEWLYERIISLPIYPGMTDLEINYVIDNVKTIAKQNAK
jgi:perosamine synthetase